MRLTISARPDARLRKWLSRLAQTRRRTGVRGRWPAGVVGTDGTGEPAGIRRSEDRRLAAAGSSRPDRDRRPVAGGAGPRRAAVPSLREFRPGGETGRASGRRSANAGDQTDALPHQRRLANHSRLGPGGAERQGGDRPGRVEGPLRRMAERELGAAAGRRRRST